MARHHAAQADLDRSIFPADGCGHHPPRPAPAGLRQRLTHGGAVWALCLPFAQAPAATRRAPHTQPRRPKTAFTCQSAIPTPAPRPHGLRRALQSTSFHHRQPLPRRAPFRRLRLGLTDGLGGAPGEAVKVPPAQPVASASLRQPPRPLPLHHQPNSGVSGGASPSKQPEGERNPEFLLPRFPRGVAPSAGRWVRGTLLCLKY